MKLRVSLLALIALTYRFPIRLKLERARLRLDDIIGPLKIEEWRMPITSSVIYSSSVRVRVLFLLLKFLQV